MLIPDTRPSLLLRIRDASDRESWGEFVEIYRQVVVRLGLIHGLQLCDAEDLSQKVLMSVSRSIDSYQSQIGQAKFRTWLKKIAKNEIINTLTRDPRFRGREVTHDPSSMPQTAVPAAGQDSTRSMELEYRRQVFLVAVSKIRNEFEEHTWKAFWSTLVDGQSVEAVATELQVSRGVIYTARCRIIARLKQVVAQIEQEEEDHE